MSDASLAPAVLETAGTQPPVPWPVIEACGLPEIGARISGLAVRIDTTLTRPFTFDTHCVTLRPDRAATVTSSALILREATALAGLPHAGFDWPHRILAHASALAYGVTTLVSRGEPAALRTFSPLADRADELVSLHDAQHDSVAAARTGHDLARAIADFLADRDEDQEPCPDTEIGRAARALPFAVPAEVLIASGGDGRQMIDWHTGVNAYGISPSPTPWVGMFGSCTASSPTTRGFEAAMGQQRRLVEAALDDRLDVTVEQDTTRMRRTLLAALGVRDEADVVFTPSGTDAEMVALQVALAADRPVHNIVVGQHEIGSGSVDAAVGRHFSHRLPSGRPSDAGALIAGMGEGDVCTTHVDLRDERGHMLPPEAVESAVQRAIDARADGYHTLVHVVEGSKTGIRLPRHETVRRWQHEYGAGLDVVVDAAQMRIDQHTAAAYAGSGCLVIVTGSKFFGGPPFSGAVIIPADPAERLKRGRQLPDGLGDYLTRAQVPAHLSDLYAVARPGLNAGLMLRWEAALAEMRSFHNVSPEIRDEVLRLLVSGLRNVISSSPHVTVVESPYTEIPKPDYRGLDDLPTIFTFLVHGPDGRALTLEEGKAAYRLLARDLRGVLPVADPVLGRAYQLGQPVKLYREGEAWIGGLRVAIGAPTVSEVVFDYTRGRLWTERIDRTLADVSDALRKLGMVVEHVDLKGW